MASVTGKAYEVIRALSRFPLKIGDAYLSFGAGAPGAAQGGKGSLYLRSDGGAGTTFYVREAAGAPVAATGVLDGITIANGDTVTIGGVTYTFVTTLAVAYDVLVDISDSATLDNLVAAITAGAGAGTKYGTGTVAHPTVTAAAGAGDTVDVTALTAGVSGNYITTTSALTAGGFASTTLTGGLADDGTGWVGK